MQKGIFEIFAENAKLRGADKAAHLKANENYALKTILQGCYHPNVKFLLPDTPPPYSESDPIGIETRVYSQIRKFDLFIEGGRNVNQTKREMIFIETLESIHPEDAKILINMVAKKDPYKGITEKIVREAFPSLLPEPESTKKS